MDAQRPAAARATASTMAATAATTAAAKVKRRIRYNALLLMSLALGFYVAFIAMSVLRSRH